MLFDDSYNIPANASQGIYKAKGSKFIAYAFPVFSEDEIKNTLKKSEKKNMLQDTIVMHTPCILTNLFGVPMTMESLLILQGKPILGQIQSKDLTNILIVVVRYFGGVKLGVGGLITAYKTAAGEAFDKHDF